MDELEDSEYDENEDTEDNEDLFEPDYEIDKKESAEETFEPDGELGEKEADEESFEPNYELGEKETDEDIFEPDYELGEKEADEDIFEPDYELDEKEADEDVFEPDYQLGEEIDEAFENIDAQNTILVHESSKMDAEYQQELSTESEKEKEIVELDPEEYEKDTEPIYDPDEVDFIRDMEELGSDLKEFHEEAGYSQSELEEYDNTAFNAEQAYQKMKEKNEEKETEEDEQHLEEQAAEQNGEALREEIKEEGDELPKEITDSEEFEYLWEEYDKLEQEGKSLEEISELMHEAEETYQMLKDFEEELEEFYERQEKQDLKSISHKNEQEDYAKEVESVYEAEYFIDAEMELLAEGKSPEEITEEMQKVENGYEFEEAVEARFEQQKKEILTSVQEDDDDQREEVDRVDVIECIVEAEEEFHEQGKSQEEIDEKTEKITNRFYKGELEEIQQRKQEKVVSEKLEESNTEFKDKDNVELEQEIINESIVEENKLETEEFEEVEYEKLQQLYHQKTGKRPIYRRRETIGFSQWLEQNELHYKKLEEKEEKKQEKERWKKTLKEWIEESKDGLLSSELKLVLKEILQKFEVIEDLCRNCVKTNLNDTKRDKWISILKKNLKKYPIHLYLYQNIYAFKAYIQECHPWEIIHIKNRFLGHLSKKYKILKQGGIRKLDHYNRWLTDKIQVYLKRLEGEIKLLFIPFIKFKNMGTLFGLYKNYIPTNRMNQNYDKIIAKSTLDKIRFNFKNIIENWIYKYPHLAHLLKIAQTDIIKFIDEYEAILQPKPSPDYQMFNNHPNFKRDYFEIIDTNEKAYWLGFMFADAYISIEHKKTGDYYRMGIQLSRKDKDVLYRFCENIGLNPKYIKDRLSGSDFSTKLYHVSEIRWGDQKLAQDLMNLGMKYEYNEKKGKRVKVPRLPNLSNRTLMLAFLLGFYDGDGTLGFDKKTGKIRPRIASSDIEFLDQIQHYFKIKYNISSTKISKLNIRKGKIIKVSCSRLDIDKEIFQKMLENYNKSLKRKRVSSDFFDS